MNKKNYQIVCLTILISAGFYLLQTAQPTGFLQASTEGWRKSDRKGLPLEMVITADDLRKKQQKKQDLLLLDARSKKSYDEAHIQGALLPLTPEYYEQEKNFKQGLSGHSPDADKALKENMKKYSKETPVVTYCSSGGCQASAVLALQIKRLGFKDVKAMEDGFQTWDKKRYPVKSGE